MKKAVLLLLCGALAFCACQKDPLLKPVKESDMKGETVDVAAMGFAYNAPRKIFILNEGQMGSNNASLDVIRFSDAQYLTGVFKKVNPSTGGLGDVGNDIAVVGNEVWIVVNNSGIVEVISAEDETEIAAIKVPTPRCIAFDNKYAYVTSWSGAFATYEKDENGISFLKDSANPKGCVYRINLSTKKLEGSLEVGYQPEGVACLDGKLYVANSGGIASQVPPSYAYDNTVSIIATGSWTVEKTIEVAPNLQEVYVDNSNKNIYVTTLGNYYDVHSALYVIQPEGGVFCASQYVSVSAQLNNDIYCIGAPEEFDWEHPERTWSAWYWKSGGKTSLAFPFEGLTPYGLFLPNDQCFLVADAGDYYNPGSVSLVAGGEKVWTVTAGVCPKHFAVWK